MLSQEQVTDALRMVVDPELKRDIVSLGFVKEIGIDGGAVTLKLEFSSQASFVLDELKEQCTKIIGALPGVERLTVEMNSNEQQGGQNPINLIPGVKNVIAIASGKGGVGKSTTAVNLAMALKQTGAKVGILDADIYGPSLPRMMNVLNPPRFEQEKGKKVDPLEQYGVSIMSMGFFMPEDTPMIWRGPMVGMAVEQLLRDIEWGELDYLVIDLPPGTGDAQLTLTQKVPINGVVIVSTPQDVALADVRKGVNMFKKVEAPVLGIIENMSYYVCPDCGHRAEIFNHGGAEKEAANTGMEFLGHVPISEDIRQDADAGKPIVVARPDSPQAKQYMAIAKKVAEKLAASEKKSKFPKIVVQ
uniref:Iron-sulfur cluster carrier protein n=1 Tax=Magnetococcus massalia (strain MO-1) TaxID=451514 RepID=A0A1S7LME5_MAGMO|nr:Protein mrp homolog. antiporter inner membrane protein [Candidatus Magnetococcus massalia]